MILLSINQYNIF